MRRTTCWKIKKNDSLIQSIDDAQVNVNNHKLHVPTHKQIQNGDKSFSKMKIINFSLIYTKVSGQVIEYNWSYHSSISPQTFVLI